MATRRHLRPRSSTQTSSALYVAVHSRMNLFSVPFIISALDYWRSNLGKKCSITCKLSGPLRGQITFNIYSLPGKPNWGLTKARCEHLSSKSHTFPTSPRFISAHHNITPGFDRGATIYCRCEAHSQILIFTPPYTQANTLMDTQKSVQTNLHLHSWVGRGLFEFRVVETQGIACVNTQVHQHSCKHTKTHTLSAKLKHTCTGTSLVSSVYLSLMRLSGSREVNTPLWHNTNKLIIAHQSGVFKWQESHIHCKSCGNSANNDERQSNDGNKWKKPW